MNDRNELIYSQCNSCAVFVDDGIHYQYANSTLRVIIVYTNILGIIKLVHTDTNDRLSAKTIQDLSDSRRSLPSAPLRRLCNGESKIEEEEKKRKNKKTDGPDQTRLRLAISSSSDRSLHFIRAW